MHTAIITTAKLRVGVCGSNSYGRSRFLILNH